MQKINSTYNPYTMSELKRRGLLKRKGINWIHWIMNIFYAVLIVLAIDFIVYAMWVLSGQVPVDGFYVGAITNAILKAIIL